MNAPSTSACAAPSHAVSRAMRQAAAHDAVDAVRLVGVDAAGAAIEIDVRTEMPAAWRAAGRSPSGVREVETVTVRLPDGYPVAAPVVELRPDFDRSHPHIQPGAADRPPTPCLTIGALRELIQARGFIGLVEQLATWLEKASTLSLNDFSQGWEPVRRDAIDDLVVADADALRATVTNAGGSQFRVADYLELEGTYRVAMSTSSVGLPVYQGGRFRRTVADGCSRGQGIGIVAWPGRRHGTPIVADRYLPETVTTLADLLDRATEYGCRETLSNKLSWAANVLHGEMPPDPVPVAVMLLARRPCDVIGTGSPIEICPYLILARSAADLREPSTPVRLAALRDHLSVPILRRASGLDPMAAQPTWTLIGCGSVGSKIASHLARAGLAPSTLLDRDWFEPHNYARHAGIPDGVSEEMFFRPKVDGVAQQMERLAQPTVARIRQDLLDLTSGNGSGSEAAPAGTEMVVDATGSPLVRETLASMPRSGSARNVETCLLAAGEMAYVAMEGPDGNPSVSDLAADAYLSISRDETLAGKVFGAAAERIAIGQGCGTTTFAMSDARLSALTAPMASILGGWLTEGPPATGETRMGALAPDGLSQTWTSASSAPWTVIEGEGSATVARIHPRVAVAIDDEIARHAGVETGGVLIGRHNAVGGFFQVVDVLPAPEDSERSADRFVLGKNGLKRSIREIVARSGGTLQAVGTWHNHLVPSGPSAIDLASGALLATRQLAPVLMLIRTPDGYSHVVAEQVGMDEAGGD